MSAFPQKRPALRSLFVAGPLPGSNANLQHISRLPNKDLVPVGLPYRVGGCNPGELNQSSISEAVSA
jgi:hypothetical protein